MSNYDKIHQLLDQRLNDGSFGLDIAWENISFTPPNDSPYLRPTFLPGGLAAFGLEIGSSNEIDGVYQIDLFYPAGAGAGAARRQADTILDQFRRGVTLTDSGSGVSVHLRESYRNPGIQETDWYQIPIVVTWKSFQSN